MRRALAIVGIAVVLSSCSWQEWVSGNVEVIPLNQGIRDSVSALGGDPTRSGYAIGLANGTGLLAIDEECGDSDGCFYDLPDSEFWWEHERMHIAYGKAGTPFGGSAEDHEHWANCGAELVTGHGPPFVQEGGYDDCSEADVARLRWVLTERLGIDFNG